MNPRTTAYDYWVRSSSVWTCSAFLFLFVAIINYLFSFAYLQVFWRYREAKKMVPELDGQNCEIPGMFILSAYSTLIVFCTGTLCIAVYVLAFVYKILHLILSLVSPIGLSNLKRGWMGHPNRDFSHYENEFDFEANPSEQPDYWNAMGPEKMHAEIDSTAVINPNGIDVGLSSGYLRDKMTGSKPFVKKGGYAPEGGCLLEEDDESTCLLSSRG
eukprot:CAMPEP_0170465968 /NCGR_PEP_ID=MMETSP0123-20130129/10115_1 /TAXON_ID=182087 /ORGANISM="Favella ehrenbergii, Strain Fehren 1" /LENGTH=214 /DNA_ID=CAMNT_0010732001 /DNA_START=379 /DNA_END=1023 /DNA_ORIENTATION=-